MFGLFKKKTELEKLQKKYEKSMAKWHRLSSINRAESDKVYQEAQLIMQEIEEQTPLGI
ncbi:MAG: Lacal_2735 family protein [Bacteroidia bacterium]|nr:Lacal_2735 family protein [Bacteroidia bacterium]NND52282.1 Lacal_2735 family protein [Flavobacteriaceae bacterium]